MGGDKNVRRVLLGSSEKDASLWHRPMTSPARVAISVICIRFRFADKTFFYEASGLPNYFRRDPAEKNESNENFPSVLVPVGRDGKVIADHNKNNGNRHESI